MEQGSSLQHISPLTSTEASSPRSSIEHSSGTKFKSRLAEKEAASTKRRCVSTACIACRKRKSKVRVKSYRSVLSNESLNMGQLSSAMVILLAVRPVPRYTEPNASMIPIPTTAAKASTRKTSTTSRPTTPPFKPLSKPSSTTPNMKYPTWSDRFERAKAWTALLNLSFPKTVTWMMM